MPKMRLGWYAGVSNCFGWRARGKLYGAMADHHGPMLTFDAKASTALAGSVVLSAFYQRANFYSAMVYLAQSNFCLLVRGSLTFGIDAPLLS